MAITDSLGNNCNNRLSGHVFYDQNGNCKRDSGEIGLNNKLLTLNNGLEYTLTDQNGHYLFITDTVLQNIKAYPNSFSNQPNDFWQISCPPTGIQTFGPSAPYQKPDSLDFAFSAVDDCPVFQIKSSLNRARVCQEGVYSLEICNDGSKDAANVVVQVTLPAEFEFLSANFPHSTDGLTYSFNLGTLPVGNCKTLNITNSVLCNAMLGTSICIEATVMGTPSCNTYQYSQTDQICRVLTNSFDPNDITGWIDNQYSCFNTNMVGEKAEVEYVIRFENTGNDLAYRIMIIDTLPTNKFDITTFRPKQSSHPYRLDFRADSVAMWIFDDINLAPHSQGFVTFSIKTASPVVAADEIKNKVAIYFDENLPILTNENSIEKCLVDAQHEAIRTPQNNLIISPNPAREYTDLLFERPLAEPVQIRLYNLSGVLTQQMTLDKGTNNWRIDTHTWPSGMYYLHIDMAYGKYVISKLIVGH